MSAESPEKYGEELAVALEAVQLASLATKKMREVIDKGTQTKSDDSPVTIADFAVQAMLISVIHSKFPRDKFIAEESSGMLIESPQLAESVMSLIRSMDNPTDNPHGLVLPITLEEAIESIDRGGEVSTDASASRRMWILDPVDGTATFMTGEQYAVCLALIENGTQKVGVLGCPNLLYNETKISVDESIVDSELDGGIILSAMAGTGSAYISRLSDDVHASRKRLPQRTTQGPFSTAEIRFVDSVKSPNVDHKIHQGIYDQCAAKQPPLDLWSMQMKYVALILGSADAAFRYPHKPTYRTYVWDHAGGQLIFEEVGGRITDLQGQRYDYSQGRRFEKNIGLVAAVGDMQPELLEKIQQIIS